MIHVARNQCFIDELGVEEMETYRHFLKLFSATWGFVQYFSIISSLSFSLICRGNTGRFSVAYLSVDQHVLNAMLNPSIYLK